MFQKYLLRILLSLPPKVLIWLSRKEQSKTYEERKLELGFQFLLSFMGDEDDHSLLSAEARKQAEEGGAYAELLKSSNVKTYHRAFEGCIHSFVNMEIVPVINEAIIKFCKGFKKIY